MKFFFPVLILVSGIISGSVPTEKSVTFEKKTEDDFPGRPAREKSQYQDMPASLEDLPESHPIVPASKYVRVIKQPSRWQRFLSCFKGKQ